MVERSPFTVEMDAMNSFNVDLLPSTIVKIGVDPCWRSVYVVSIRVQMLDMVALLFFVYGLVDTFSSTLEIAV